MVANHARAPCPLTQTARVPHQRAQAAGATALDAAAAGRAVLGVVQRIARQVGVRPTSVIEEGGRSNKGKDEV